VAGEIENMMFKKLIGPMMVALTAFALGGQGVGPAVAEVSITNRVPMTFTGFDREVAAENGYEIRTDATGHECSVAIGTPSGPCPTYASQDGGDLTTQNTVYGDCGYTWLYWRSSATAFETGYYIYSSWGRPAVHAWTVYLWTSAGPQIWDLSGAPATGSSRWEAARSIGADGQSGFASGEVIMTNGASCSAGFRVRPDVGF
jgi:hypothetical protein